MTLVSISCVGPTTPKTTSSDPGPSGSQSQNLTPRKPLRSSKSLGSLKLPFFFSPLQKTFNSEEYLNLIPTSLSGSSELTDLTETKPKEAQECPPAPGTPVRPRKALRRALSPDSPEEQSPFQITSRLFEDEVESSGSPGSPGPSNPSGTRDLIVLETPKASRKSRLSLRPEGAKRKLSSSPMSPRGLFPSKSLRTPGSSSSAGLPGQLKETPTIRRSPEATGSPGPSESLFSIGTPTDLRTLRTPESSGRPSETLGTLGSARIFGTPKSSRTPKTCRISNTPSTPQTVNNLTFSDTIGRHLPSRIIQIPADWTKDIQEQEQEALGDTENDDYNGPISPEGPGTPLTTKRKRSSKRENTVRPPILMAAPSKRRSSVGARDLKARFINSNGSTTPIVSPSYDRAKKTSYLEQTFSLDAIIGKGSFGEVFLARSQETQEGYAVKVSVRLVKQSSSVKYREVLNLMSLPAHPNVVGFVKAWEEADRLYIQTELCQMSLSDYSDRVPRIPESQVWRFFKDLINALDHIHRHNMVHADVKPENVFLDDKMACKLGDFGLAINLNKNTDIQEAEEGDSRYLAPEVLNGAPTKEADIFSLGITILEVATDLNVPSGGSGWNAIRNGDIPKRFLNRISKDLQSVISSMLHKNPENRPTAFDLQKHFLNQEQL